MTVQSILQTQINIQANLIDLNKEIRACARDTREKTESCAQKCFDVAKQIGDFGHACWTRAAPFSIPPTFLIGMLVFATLCPHAAIGAVAGTLAVFALTAIVFAAFFTVGLILEGVSYFHQNTNLADDVLAKAEDLAKLAERQWRNSTPTTKEFISALREKVNELKMAVDAFNNEMYNIRHDSRQYEDLQALSKKLGCLVGRLDTLSSQVALQEANKLGITNQPILNLQRQNKALQIEVYTITKLLDLYSFWNSELNEVVHAQDDGLDDMYYDDEDEYIQDLAETKQSLLKITNELNNYGGIDKAIIKIKSNKIIIEKNEQQIHLLCHAL